MLASHAKAHRLQALATYDHILNAHKQVPSVKSYDCLLKMLITLPPNRMSQADRVNEMIRFCKDMSSFGVHPTDETLQILFFSRHSAPLMRLVRDRFHEKGKDSITSAESEGARNWCVDLLENLFAGSDCLDSVATYEHLLTLIAKYEGCDGLADAAAVCAKMKHRNLAPTLAFYNALIRLYCSCAIENENLSRQAAVDRFARGGTIVAFLDEMKSIGLQPDAASFYPMIEASAKMKNLKIALELFTRMLSEVPNASSFDTPNVPACYCAMVVAFVRERDVDHAEELFARMTANQPADCPEFECNRELQNWRVGVEPFATAYSYMIHLYALKGQLARATELFDKLDAMWGRDDPKAFAFTALIHALAKANDRVAAQKRFDEMKRRGLRPSVKTYNSMIWLAVQECDAAEARALRDEMLANGVSLDVVVYTTLIEGSARRSDCGEALAYLKEMKAAGVMPNAATYSVLMKLSMRLKDRTSVIRFWSEMRAQGIDPSVASKKKKRLAYAILE
jgi:pentatricopeptide repeat protein